MNCLAVLLIGIAAIAPGAVAEQAAPLPLVLPKPMFEGTPRNQRVPNLEEPLGKPRRPFFAPAGTVNVALNQPVSSSTPDPSTGDLEMVTDGEKSGVDGSYVELGDGVQHVTIDLGARHVIYAVVFWHYHKSPRVYHDVIVQAADDPDCITNVRTLFNNDHDNSAGVGIGSAKNYVNTAEGKLVDMRGVEARYVRLYSNGNSENRLNHYVEVEVYGRPLK